MLHTVPSGIGLLIAGMLAVSPLSVLAAGEQPSPRLRILTINLLYKSPVAGRDTRFDTIARYIRDQRDEGRPVDALLVQEGCSGLLAGTGDSIRDLRRTLNEYGMRYPMCSHPAFGVSPFLAIRIGILTNRDVLYSEAEDLQSPPGEWYEKFPLLGRKRVAMVGIAHPIGRVNLFATHLSSRGGEDIRKGQAEDLLRFVNKVSARHPADVAVLGGDMNTQPGTNAYNLLAGAFTDSYAAAVPGSPGCTFNLPGNPHCQGITSKTRRIDYIFFTGAGIHVEASEVVFNKDGWWVSDHCGLLTTLAK